MREANMLLAYHRMLMRGSFERATLLAIGTLLLMGLGLLWGAIRTGTGGLIAGAGVITLLCVAFSSIVLLTTASRTANSEVHRLAPSANSLAYRYLMGLWWLQACLGTLVAYLAGISPVFGFAAGLLYAFIGQTMGGKARMNLLVFAVLVFMGKLEDDSQALSTLPWPAQAALYGLIGWGAWQHARAGMRFAIDPSRAPRQVELGLAQRQAAGVGALVREATASLRAALGLGPIFSTAHRTMPLAIAMAPLSMIVFGPRTAIEYYALLGVAGGLVVAAYLEWMWHAERSAAAARAVLMLTPGLPVAADWRPALAALLQKRALGLGALTLVLVAGVGLLRYGALPGMSWWVIGVATMVVPSFGAFSMEDDSLLMRTHAMLLGILGLFIVVAIYLIKHGTLLT